MDKKETYSYKDSGNVQRVIELINQKQEETKKAIEMRQAENRAALKNRK